jgi:hypothetical protein
MGTTVRMRSAAFSRPTPPCAGSPARLVAPDEHLLLRNRCRRAGGRAHASRWTATGPGMAPRRARARETRRGLLRGWASGTAPAESPPMPARTARGMCGQRTANRDHGRGARAHPLAVAHGELALTWRGRASAENRRSIRSPPTVEVDARTLTSLVVERQCRKLRRPRSGARGAHIDAAKPSGRLGGSNSSGRVVLGRLRRVCFLFNSCTDAGTRSPPAVDRATGRR